MLCVQYDNSNSQRKFYKVPISSKVHPDGIAIFKTQLIGILTCLAQVPNHKELAQTELGYSQWKASLPVVIVFVASNDVMLTYLLQVIVDRYYDSGDSIGAVFSSIEADSALVCACCAVQCFASLHARHNLLARWQLLPSLPLPTNTQLQNVFFGY